MPAATPPWVVKELSSILGLDDESVKQMLLPDLEGYTSEVRLRGHLQDFLGTSTSAKAFATRYLALRFPSISTIIPRPMSPPSLKPSASTPARLQSSHSPNLNIAEDLQAAFGPGGKVYQKNRDVDSFEWSTRPAPASSSKLDSGTVTPSGGPVFREPKPVRGGTLAVNDETRRTTSGGSGGGAGKKGKEKEKIWDLPKSRAVRKLEGIIDDLKGLREGEGKVGTEEGLECFCQARVHPLSPYTPHCSRCGLVICSLHPAHHPCPSCHHPLLSPAQLSRLLLRIQSELDTQFIHEQSERDHDERDRLARLAAESGGGAFPILPGAQRSISQGQDSSRKILTIGSKAGKGKSTLTTTTFRPPSTPGTPAEPVTPPPTDIISRPRTSPLDAARIEKEVSKMLSWRTAEDRPWGDMKAEKNGDWFQYVEMDMPVMIQEDRDGRRKAARKKKKGEGEGGRVVPGVPGAS